MYVPIGCQSCIECRKQKARDWQVRLSEDIKEFKNGKFVTLTFSTEGLKKIYNHYDNLIEKYKDNKRYALKLVKWEEENKKFKDFKGYDLDNSIVTRGVRFFLERWRKEYGKSVRHWLVSELGHGTTEHVHLHGIIWADDVNEIEKIWQYGFVWKGNVINGKLENYVSGRTVNYMVKYINKVDIEHANYRSLVLCSPGIGRRYTTSMNIRNNKFKGERTDEGYRTESGHKLALPIYYRNKVYSEREREDLWLMKLDKGERYVCGEKIRIRSEEDEERYMKLVEYHRERTNGLGYPKPEFIWKKKEYEKQRREMLHEKRIRYSHKGSGGDNTPAL